MKKTGESVRINDELERLVADVNITAPADGDILTYDAGTSKWINGNGIPVNIDLDDLTDVVLTAPIADDSLLQFDIVTGRWVNITVASIAGSLDHGSLTGLGDDDHTQYLLADGTKDLTGDWTIATDSIRLTAGSLTTDGDTQGYIDSTGLWMLESIYSNGISDITGSVGIIFDIGSAYQIYLFGTGLSLGNQGLFEVNQISDGTNVLTMGIDPWDLQGGLAIGAGFDLLTAGITQGFFASLGDVWVLNEIYTNNLYDLSGNLKIDLQTSPLVEIPESSYIHDATVGDKVAPLRVRQDNAYAAPFTQYVQLWENTVGTVIASLLASGKFVTGSFIEGYNFNASNNGTESAAAFNFVGDIDNGMYKIGTNNVGLTAGGAKILDLTSTAVKIGKGTAGVDYTLTFDGQNNDGVITWMEDEDYFKFSDDIYMDNEEISAAKFKITSTGGYAIKLTNRTGGNTVQGQLVKADTANNDSFVLTAANDDECFGVVLDSGVANASEAWIVVAGIADVALADNTTATTSYWMQTSAEAGYADGSNAAPNPVTHFQEIGHCIETVAATGAGTHVLARTVLHFN